MIPLIAFLASLALVVGYWCLISLTAALLWWGMLALSDWLVPMPVVHPKGHPLVCIRGETPADAIRVLIDEIAA